MISRPISAFAFADSGLALSGLALPLTSPILHVSFTCVERGLKSAAPAHKRTLAFPLALLEWGISEIRVRA